MAANGSANAIVVCVDGSELSLAAAAAGLSLLDHPERVVVLTVVEASDPGLVSGSGIAGGVMSPDEFDEFDAGVEVRGHQVALDAATALGIAGAEVVVLRGDAGPTACTFAAELPARALVLGSRGRGGLKRAVLGSFSDYVVRNAACPVVVSRPTD